MQSARAADPADWSTSPAAAHSRRPRSDDRPASVDDEHLARHEARSVRSEEEQRAASSPSGRPAPSACGRAATPSSARRGTSRRSSRSGTSPARARSRARRGAPTALRARASGSPGRPWRPRRRPACTWPEPTTPSIEATLITLPRPAASMSRPKRCAHRKEPVSITSTALASRRAFAPRRARSS